MKQGLNTAPSHDGRWREDCDQRPNIPVPSRKSGDPVPVVTLEYVVTLTVRVLNCVDRNRTATTAATTLRSTFVDAKQELPEHSLYKLIRSKHWNRPHRNKVSL